MNALTTFTFDGAAVRTTLGEDGEPLFVGKDVCEVLGYANPAKAMQDHCKGVTIRYPLQTQGGMQEVRVLSEPDVLRLIVRSRLPAAEAFERWIFEDVLPSIRKTGTYSMPSRARPQTLSRNQVAAALLLLRSAAEDLKLAPSAVLGGYLHLENQLGVAGLLPGYAVDASNSSTAGSSEETRAAAVLLEEFGVGLSAIAFNRLLVQHGFLEERERPSSKGGTKKFKVCVNLEFGKNLTSPSNPRETQPHWYVHKFADLLERVLPPKPSVASA